MNKFEWFVARRYLFSSERRTLVSVITMISMAGVAVGVAALIVVIGVMDGADELLFGRIADLTPHLRIEHPAGPDGQFDKELLKQLLEREDTIAVEPVINRLAVFQKKIGNTVKMEPANLIGMENLGEGSLYSLKDQHGTPISGLDGKPIQLGPGEILLGLPLAYKLNVRPGDKVRVTANNPVVTAQGAQAKRMDLRVVGVFRAGYYDFDALHGFVSTKTIRRLYRIRNPEGADYLHVKLTDPFMADAVKKSLFDYGYKIRTWAEENSNFFAALKLEKWMLFIILLLIIVVAGFNIIGTLILMVSDKTREIGIMKAMGAPEQLIGRIFLANGLMIGLIGTVLGVIAGLVIAMLIPYLPIDLPESVYNFDRLPVRVEPVTVAAIVGASMIICIISAVFPARQAAKMDPVEALRHDT
jgi:lipoprotein-releasing system permease protein